MSEQNTGRAEPAGDAPAAAGAESTAALTNEHALLDEYRELVVYGPKGAVDLWVLMLAARLDETTAALAQAQRERDRETEVRREAEEHVRVLQGALQRKPYADEYDDLEQRFKAADQQLRTIQGALQQIGAEMNRMIDTPQSRYVNKHQVQGWRDRIAALGGQP